MTHHPNQQQPRRRLLLGAPALLLAGCLTSDYQVLPSDTALDPTAACDPSACDPAPAPCLVPVCAADACAYELAADGSPCFRDLCSLGATCLAGACTPAITNTCPDLDGPCQRGACNPNTGACAIEPLPDGTLCALDPNQDPCALSGQGACAAGLCLPQPSPSQLIYLQDFAKEDDGWSTEHPWQLGPAQPSSCAESGPEDPPNDHSGAADQRLAGLLIGACLAANSAPNACLTSPPIPLPGLAPVLLEFWATEPPPPPLSTTVELFDGLTWQLLAPQQLEADPKQLWRRYQQHLMPADPRTLQLRFCVRAQQPLLQSLAGWSLDDIRLDLSACPGACDQLLQDCLTSGAAPELCAEKYDACANNDDPAP